MSFTASLSTVSSDATVLIAQELKLSPLLILGLFAGVFGLLILLGLVAAFLKYGNLWLQAYTSRADISLVSLIRMGFCQIQSPVIVKAKVMAVQAKLDINRQSGISTKRLEATTLRAAT